LPTFHISEARRNNGTPNLTGYYGWGLLPGTPAACVVEHGFLTNPTERDWMNEHAEELADGEYRAILAQLGLAAEDAPSRTTDRPDHDAQWPWFVEWSLWTLGRGEYEAFGPHNRAVRPPSAPSPVPRRAQKILRELRSPVEPESPPTEPVERARVTTRSLLLAPARATKAQLVRYVVDRPHGPRTDEEAREVAELYHELASDGGLDPVLATAQWCSNREPDVAVVAATAPEPGRDRRDLERHGPRGRAEVPNLKAAVTGHVGRLLAYAVPLGEENSAQRALIDKALEARPLADTMRGVATSPRGLAGTWAADPGYAKKIARLANEIISGS
jgi:hypothetical protein